MDSIRRNKLQDLITVGSQRVAFHPIIPYHRQTLHPLVKEHGQYVSYDKAIVTGLVLCKHCHQIFPNARWNNKFILEHLQQVHKIAGPEEAVPKINSETSMAPTPACASLMKSKEAKIPLTPEVIIIDDDEDPAPLTVECPQMVMPIKKKRGRKPKEISNGSQAKEKTKNVEKKMVKRMGEVKLKRHYTKKRKVDEAAKEKPTFD